MPVLTTEERIGTEIAGKYRLDALLGQGGMGVVFAGVHRWTGREVAVKLLHPEFARNEQVGRRFLQEARTAAALRHPNVVDVLDMGEEPDGTIYLVLELLHGQSLAHLIDHEGPLAPQACLTLIVPVFGALIAAHDRGFVHRDLKPDNIFLTEDAAGRSTPKLLDFGIAKTLQRASLGTTRTGMVVGTPHYMSPEQAAGDRDVGPQADVWSIGVVLYECLSGQLPFEAEHAMGILMQIAGGRHTPLQEAAPLLPAKLAEAVEGALITDRKKRHPTMRAFLEALEAAAKDAQLTLPEVITTARRSAESPSGKLETVSASQAALAPARPRDATELSDPIGTGETLIARTGEHEQDAAPAPVRDRRTPYASVHTVAEQPAVPPRRRAGLIAGVVLGAAGLAAIGFVLAQGSGDERPAATRGVAPLATPDPIVRTPPPIPPAPPARVVDPLAPPAEPAAVAGDPSPTAVAGAPPARRGRDGRRGALTPEDLAEPMQVAGEPAIPPALRAPIPTPPPVAPPAPRVEPSPPPAVITPPPPAPTPPPVATPREDPPARRDPPPAKRGPGLAREWE